MGECHLMIMCSVDGYVRHDHGGLLPEQSFFTGVGKNDQIQDSRHTASNSKMVNFLCTFLLECGHLMMMCAAYGYDLHVTIMEVFFLNCVSQG